MTEKMEREGKEKEVVGAQLVLGEETECSVFFLSGRAERTGLCGKAQFQKKTFIIL